MCCFGFLYSPAYPLGPRLGVTVFWQPAAIQDAFLKTLTRRCLIISQWLVLWFYTQKIYFASLDIINTTTQSSALLISLAYLGVPRGLWRKKRRRLGKRRKRVLRRKILWKPTPITQRPLYQFNRSFVLPFTPTPTALDRVWPITGLLRVDRPYRSPAVAGGIRKVGSFFLNYNRRLKRMHTDLIHRFLSGFYRTVVIKNYQVYKGPRKGIKKQRIVIRKRLSNQVTFNVRAPFELRWYRQMWLLKFLTKRRQFLGRHLYRRLARKSAGCRTRITHLRFFWYVKLCFETYFHHQILLSCTNLYLSYFQAGVITRFQVRERSVLTRYIRGLKQRRNTNVSKFRRLARDLSFRPGKPSTVNKFSYTQIVLFLGLHPGWRKLVNAYSLCYIIITSALLKNVQMLSQWLYNMVSLGQTRRFRLMRMRFFMLVAKLLRDYAVFGQYLKGFRIEVYGKTGRSQKTRTRFFGDTTGLRFYRLSFRMNYQAFDIPTFAGVLGVRFWLY